MTELNQVYRCNVCGNLVNLLHAGAGQLVCCGQPMELLTAKSTDEGQEKHLPVIENNGQEITVKIGSIPHPMEEAHYLEWIEILADGKAYRQHLAPQDQPQVKFCLQAETVTARVYCNIHGLWQK